jgi:copper chaperone CopZ
MKKMIRIPSVIILVALLFSGVAMKAQTSAMKEETFKVKGNCEMCKKTIEKALNAIDGVKSAKWNVETKIINVKFDTKKLSLARVKGAIAAAGYDSEGYKASDQAYEKLHKCCQYDRE